MNKALIVIDVQEDFTRGALRNEDAIAALPTIRQAVDFAYEHLDRPILYTKDTHSDKYYLDTQEGKNLPIKHCIEGTKGWRICPEVFCDKNDIMIKHGFGTTDWSFKNLSSTDEIWLCGFCTDICVVANFFCIKARFPETKIVVIEDACAGTSREHHDAAITVMRSCQGRIVTWEELRKENEEQMKMWEGEN